MKKIVILISCLLPLLCQSQGPQENSFSSFQNWQAVLDSAKASNKKILVDAYATWCGPCKEMDAKVFPEASVRRYIDLNFIAVKVQMDQTENDRFEVKKWYEFASMLTNKYQIASFPSLVFLDPDGNLIQMNTGYHDPRKFLAILKQANDPTQSYTHRIASYKQNQIAAKDLLDLALCSKKYKQDTLAMQIARSYKKRFLDKQRFSEVMRLKIADEMILNFYPLFSFHDRIIQCLYDSPQQMDSIFNRKNFSTQWTDFFIAKEMIEPQVRPLRDGIKRGKPEWAKMRSRIEKRFDAGTAKRVILNQQIFYYHKKKDYENAVRYEIEKIENYGLDTAGFGKSTLNGLMFYIVFQHCNNPEYLKKGIGYMTTIIATNPTNEAWIDTYANLLYKVGDKEKAIQQQQLALAIAKAKNVETYIKEFTQNLRKMEAGEPTWIIDNQ
jgi:thioredoxin-related protein